MSASLMQGAAADVSAQQDEQQQRTRIDGVRVGLQGAEGAGLSSPLEDADIFNALFNKWGGDDAAEVGSLGEFLFAENGIAAAGAPGGLGTGGIQCAPPSRALTEQQGRQKQHEHQQQQQQQQQQQGTAVQPLSSEAQQKPPPPQQQHTELQGGQGASGLQQPPVDAAAAASAAYHAFLRPDSLMVSQQSMQAMHAVLQLQQQLITQSASAVSRGAGQEQRPAAQPGQAEAAWQLHAPLPPHCAVSPLGPPVNSQGTQGQPAAGAPPVATAGPSMGCWLPGMTTNTEAAGMQCISSMAPAMPMWPQLMLQHMFHHQQQQQLLVPAPALAGASLPGPLEALGPAGMFGPVAAAAAAAAAAAGLPGLYGPVLNPCPSGIHGLPVGATAQMLAWQQQQQQQSLASCGPLCSLQGAAGQQAQHQMLPDLPQAAASGDAVCAAEAAAAAGAPAATAAAGAAAGATAAGVPGTPSGHGPSAAPTPASSVPSLEGVLGAAADAATGSALPPLPAPLPQELLSALMGSMPLQAHNPGPAAAAAAAAAGMLPGSWPIHLLGLLRPPGVAVPSVMQLAMMTQAAAQAAVLPGGGSLQQTAMLVAAIQSLASSNMQGPFGPWSNVPPWQQPPPQQQQQHLPHNNTQNNGSCLGQFGHLMSSTQGFGGQGLLKPDVQPGSQPQGGSHQLGSHYVGSHHQTSTTGDYSGMAGDVGGAHSQSLAAAPHWQPAGSAAATGAAAGGPTPHQQWLAPGEQQQWQSAAAAREAAAAELAAVEAINPHHSKPHAKGSSRRHGRAGESRRSRANNRPRVKGRFVKKGTPGAAVAGAEPDACEGQHTALSDHEDVSEVNTAEAEGEQQQPPHPQQLDTHMLEADKDTGAGAGHMLLDSWDDMQPAAAAAAARGHAAADACADGQGDRVLLMSPGNAASCWAEVLGAPGFGDADIAWQAQRSSQALTSALQQQVGEQPAAAQQTAGDTAAHEAAGGACPGGPTRVERLYSSKRSWVTQQFEGACTSSHLAAAVPCDSLNTGPLLCEDVQELVQQHRQRRSCSNLPGAAGPSSSDGGGFPGLFSAPVGCLDAAGAGPVWSGGVLRDPHTCLYHCDSNRLAGSKQQVQLLTHEASKRQRSTTADKGPREPSSAAAAATTVAALPTAVMRSGSLTSSRLLLSPAASGVLPSLTAGDAAAAGRERLPAPASTMVPPLVPAAPGASQAGAANTAAGAAEAAMQPTDGRSQAADASHNPAHQPQGVVAEPGSCSKRQRVGTSRESAQNVAEPLLLNPVGAQGDVDMAAAAGASGVGGGAAAGHGGPARVSHMWLAPPPVDNAAAAAQMPPPAAHPRPHSATSTGATAAPGGPLPAGLLAAGLARLAEAPAAPAVQPCAAVAAGSVPAAALSLPMLHGPAGMQALSVNLLLQQAQQQLQLQPALQQQQVWRLVTAAQQLPLGLGVPGVPPAVAAGLQLQGLSGAVAHTGQQQPQLGLAGLWPAAPAAMRPWGVPAVAAAVAAASTPRPLAPAQAVGGLPGPALPGGAFLAPFGAGGFPPGHPAGVMMAAAALNSAGGVFFGGPGAALGALRPPGGAGVGASGAGRRHQAEGSEQADSCLP